MPPTQPKSAGKRAARRDRYSLDADPTTRKIETVADKSFQMADANIAYVVSVQRGLYEENLGKENQDTFCVQEQLCNGKEGALFAIFDGHGSYGGEVAKFVAEELPKILAEKFEKLSDDPSDDAMEEMLKESFKETDKSLRENKHIDSNYSGTTAAVAIIDKGGKRIVVANVGDSRIILGYEVEDDEGELGYDVRQITEDHKPNPKDNQAEYDRILKTGKTRVATNQQHLFCFGTGRTTEDVEYPDAEDDEPLRVYKEDWTGAGCAFSRSLGDHASEGLGIISTPDVYFVDLVDLPYDKVISILMLAITDGIWEHFDNQDLGDAVHQKLNSPGAQGKPMQHATTSVIQHAGQACARLYGYHDDKTIQMVEIVPVNNRNIQAKNKNDDDDDSGALDNEQDTGEGSREKKLPPRTPFAKAVIDGHPTEGTTTLSPKGQTILNQSSALYEAVSAMKISAQAQLEDAHSRRDIVGLVKTLSERKLSESKLSETNMTGLSPGATPISKASGASEASGTGTASKPSGTGTASKRAKKVPTIIKPFSPDEVNVRILKGDYTGWHGKYLRKLGGYHYIGVYSKKDGQYYETRKKDNAADPSYEQLAKMTD